MKNKHCGIHSLKFCLSKCEARISSWASRHLLYSAQKGYHFQMNNKIHEQLMHQQKISKMGAGRSITLFQQLFFSIDYEESLESQCKFDA